VVMLVRSEHRSANVQYSLLTLKKLALVSVFPLLGPMMHNTAPGVDSLYPDGGIYWIRDMLDDHCPCGGQLCDVE
jgi:hypothetical protein